MKPYCSESCTVEGKELTDTSLRKGKANCIQEKRFHHKGGQEQEQVSRSCGVSILGEIQRQTGHSLSNLDLG